MHLGAPSLPYHLQGSEGCSLGYGIFTWTAASLLLLSNPWNQEWKTSQTNLQPSTHLGELWGFANNCSLEYENRVHVLFCLCFSSKGCTSQRDLLFIWLGSSFLWEKNLWLIQAIPKCQFVLSNAWSTSVSIQENDKTSYISEHWCVNMCTYTRVIVKTWWYEASNKCAMERNKSILNTERNYYRSCTLLHEEDLKCIKAQEWISSSS